MRQWAGSVGDGPLMRRFLAGLLRERISCVMVELEAKTTVLATSPLTLTLSPVGERG